MPKHAHLPLPDGYFRAPPLTDDERHRYIRLGQRELVSFVEKTRLRGGPIAWTFDHEANGVTVYRGVDTSLPVDNRRVYLNVTEVQATLDEAAVLMSAGLEGTRDYCALYHKDQVVDLKNIYVIAAPTPTHPHNSVCIKWRAVSANNPLIKCRDMVFMEYCDDFSIDGVKGFGRCMSSIKLDHVVPDLQKSLNLVRCHMYVGGDIFLESEQRPGFLTAFRIYQQDLKGSLPPWLVTRLVKRKVSQCLAELDRNFRNERVLALDANDALLPTYAMTPLSARTNCALCLQKFCSIYRKSQCYKCGEVLCKKCNRPWRLSADSGSRVVRVCNSCTSSQSSALRVSSLFGVRRPYRSVYSTETSASDDERQHLQRRAHSDNSMREKSRKRTTPTGVVRDIRWRDLERSQSLATNSTNSSADCCVDVNPVVTREMRQLRNMMEVLQCSSVDDATGRMDGSKSSEMWCRS